MTDDPKLREEFERRFVHKGEDCDDPPEKWTWTILGSFPIEVWAWVTALLERREAEARIDELRHWNNPYAPNAMDKRIVELQVQIAELQAQLDAAKAKVPQ